MSQYAAELQDHSVDRDQVPDRGRKRLTREQDALGLALLSYIQVGGFEWTGGTGGTSGPELK